MPAQRTAKKARKDPRLSKPTSKSSTPDDSDKENTQRPSKKSEKSGDTSLDLDFMTMPRPMFDFHREHDVEAMSKAQIAKLQKEYNKHNEKKFKADLKDFPDHPWVVSKQAYEMCADMDVAFQKRNVERFGMYIYNDSYGYGIGEVIEIHWLSFAREFKKAKPSIGELWSRIEAFAWLLLDHHDDVTGVWGGIDDGEGIGETVSIICQAILAMLSLFEKEDMWDAVPNLSTILSIYFAIFPDFDDAFDCIDDESAKRYPTMIRAVADRHGMKIQGIYKIEDCLKKYNMKDLNDEQRKLVDQPAAKDKFGFKQNWQKFQKDHIPTATVRGHLLHDVTKAERIKASFDNKDPLADMPPAPSSGIY